VIEAGVLTAWSRQPTVLDAPAGAPEEAQGTAAAAAAIPQPFVFVTVGTDHHPFDRLIRWSDAWFMDRGLAPDRGLVQVGTSAVEPDSIESRRYLRAEEMRAAMGAATVVVCHGGPSTVMSCRRSGFRPIVVPRRQALGEHVDDHQFRFSRWLARDPNFEVVDDEARFRALLDAAAADPGAFRSAEPVPEVGEAARRFGRLVDELFVA
jgi:UDP-N-acetylglucosamine transferase subunit ALG13